MTEKQMIEFMVNLKARVAAGEITIEQAKELRKAIHTEVVRGL